NPDANVGYCTCEVEYWKAGFDPNTFDMSGLFLSYTDDAGIKRRYDEVAGKVRLLPSGPWVEIGHCEHVLEKAPKEVRGFIHESRTVLVRVGKEDCTLLQAARQKTDPTVADLNALIGVVNGVLDSAQ